MITIKGYTQDDLDYIINNYNNFTVDELSKRINKSYNSTYNAIRKLGLVKQFHNEWTDVEIEFLKNNYSTMTSSEISKYIKHSIASINTMKDSLGLIKTPNWSNSEVKYLKENYMNKSYNEIGKILNKSEGAVRAKCFDLGLYKKELPWTEKETQYVVENYSSMSIKKMAEYLHRTANAVKIHASKMGLKKSPYNCNYHYFDSIDTEEKAYWLGFLTADGWVYYNEKTNSGCIGIELQYSDINHLKKFNKSINGNYKITDRWRKCLISTKPNSKSHECCIRIFSLIMYNSLVNYGFSNNKTYNISIPKIPKELIKHYIRGYFDGDGRFGLSSNRLWVAFCMASEELKNDIVHILQDLDIKSYINSNTNEYNTTIYSIEITSNINKIKFLDWIYKDSNIYLDRKYKKYLKAKQIYGSLTESLAS